MSESFQSRLGQHNMEIMQHETPMPEAQMLDLHANTVFLATRIQALAFRADTDIKNRRRAAPTSDFVRFHAPAAQRR